MPALGRALALLLALPASFPSRTPQGVSTSECVGVRTPTHARTNAQVRVFCFLLLWSVHSTDRAFDAHSACPQRPPTNAHGSSELYRVWVGGLCNRWQATVAVMRNRSLLIDHFIPICIPFIPDRSCGRNRLPPPLRVSYVWHVQSSSQTLRPVDRRPPHGWWSLVVQSDERIRA